MSTTRTSTSEHSLSTTLGYGELPPLSTTDRFALRLALALILRAQRRAEAAERDEQARRSGASQRAAQQRDITFEHRHQAGPTW